MFQIAKQHKKAWERCVHDMLADVVPYLCQLVVSVPVSLVLLFPNKAGEWSSWSTAKPTIVFSPGHSFNQV